MRAPWYSGGVAASPIHSELIILQHSETTTYEPLQSAAVSYEVAHGKSVAQCKRVLSYAKAYE